MTDLDQMKQDRGSDYGPVAQNHRSIGKIWGGIMLQAWGAGRWKPGDDVPAELVTLMMVGVKVSREAYRHKADNVDDGKNYWDFTGELSTPADPWIPIPATAEVE
jgi:hypothetical protein